MRVLVAASGCILIFVVLWDAFETIVLPRRVTRRIRLTRLFYYYTWQPWRTLARRMHRSKRRDSYLGFYGPLSLLVLLSIWAISLGAPRRRHYSFNRRHRNPRRGTFILRLVNSE